MIIEEKIKSGHARAILGITDGDEQYKIAVQIFDESLSVRETEKLVKKYLSEKGKPDKPDSKQDIQSEIIYKNYEEKLKTVMGTKVNINHKGKGKGKIEIEYFSADEFDRIIEMMMSMQS
jgi:ParB family chromosome partitioning protein